MSEQEPDDRTQWGRNLGLGLEVMTGVLLGLAAGWWLDGRYGWSPWGTLLGMMLGLAGGMYLLIKQTLHSGGDK